MSIVTEAGAKFVQKEIRPRVGGTVRVVLSPE